MPLSKFEGAAVIGATEYSLPNQSVTLTPRAEEGPFQFVLDAAAMQDGDEFRFKIYETVFAGATQRLVEEYSISEAQPKPLIYFPSILLSGGWDVTLQKVGGVDREFKWSLRYSAG